VHRGSDADGEDDAMDEGRMSSRGLERCEGAVDTLSKYIAPAVGEYDVQ
jgi:hypothetical protein